MDFVFFFFCSVVCSGALAKASVSRPFSVLCGAPSVVCLRFSSAMASLLVLNKLVAALLRFATCFVAGANRRRYNNAIKNRPFRAGPPLLRSSGLLLRVYT